MIISLAQFQSAVDNLHRLQRAQRGLGDVDESGDPIPSEPSLDPAPSVINVPLFGQGPSLVSTSQSGSSPTGATPGGGFNFSALANAITAGAAGAASVLRAANTPSAPSLVRGTNLVYNPANGQLIPGSGAGLTIGGGTATATLFSSPVLLIGIAGLALLLLAGKR